MRCIFRYHLKHNRVSELMKKLALCIKNAHTFHLNKTRDEQIGNKKEEKVYAAINEKMQADKSLTFIDSTSKRWLNIREGEREEHAVMVETYFL